MLPAGDGAVADGRDRFVVAAVHGRFTVTPPTLVTTEGRWVETGDVLGVLERGAERIDVVAPVRASVLAFVAEDGDRVRPGDVLVHLEAL